jgi:FkbM family methyltransferase
LIKAFKKFIKRSFNVLGLDIIRLSKTPTSTLLGLRNLPFKTILDVGANRGQFAEFLASRFPNAHIYSFEPLPNTFADLSNLAENMRNKKKQRVDVFNLALGEEEKVIEIICHEDHTPSSSFLQTTEFLEGMYPLTKKQLPISVKMTTLDRWRKEQQIELEPEILIKVDVQGFEDRVIKGGEETFGMAKACILEMNIDQLYKDQASCKDLFLLLYNLGYHYAGNLDQSFAFASDMHVISVDAIFIR